MATYLPKGTLLNVYAVVDMMDNIKSALSTVIDWRPSGDKLLPGPTVT